MKLKETISITIRIFLILIAGFFLFTFVGPYYFDDPDIRVSKNHPRHEFCLKSSERKSMLGGGPALETAINKGTVNAEMIENERKNYVAQVNRYYSECLSDFDLLPKKCYDQFNAEYYAKGFDPEKYADFRKDKVKECIENGEMEAECKNQYSSGDLEFCLRKKQKRKS
jgi:hypothetical protein